MWLTAFGRNFYNTVIANCVPNSYAALFDGVNDFATFGGWPSIVPIGGQSKQAIISMWVEMNKTAPTNVAQFFFTQNTGSNNTNDFFRVLYQPRNSSGVPLNRIAIEWRANGTTNNIQKQFALHDNSAITGSTSSTSYWLSPAANPSINTNANGYVHLLAIFDMPPIGQAMSNGNLDVFWNGQLLTNAVVNQKQGTSQTSIPVNSLSGYLAVNGSAGSSFHQGKIDELFIVEDSAAVIWKSVNSLSTNQDVADYLYNFGCPVDIGNDARWTYDWFRFENNWNAGWNGSGGAFIPVNGATFTTDYA